MNISRPESVGKKSNKTIFLLIFFSTLFTLSFYSQDVFAQTSDGTVSSEQKISDTAGGFGGVLDDADAFGFSLANIGDLDGDGIEDLATGARLDDDGGTNRGAVWILFMNSDGTVSSEQKISDTAGGFGGLLANGDSFGYRIANIGDLDGDGIEDLAVTTPFSDDGGADRGAVWILFMNSDGTVSSEQKISDTAGGFGGVLDNGDTFGTAIANLGDLDGDGVEDLVVGANGDDDGGFGDCLNSSPQICNGGAIWVLFMNSDGTVSSEQKISSTAGGFGGVFDVNDNSGFGSSLVGLNDFDGNGVKDLAVGIANDDDGGTNRGAVWILFLNSDGTVSSEQKISDTAGGFGGVLNDGDQFGFSIAKIGDLDGDGVEDLVVGSPLNDDGGLLRGAVWILFMNSDGTVSSEQKISDTAGGFGGVLEDFDLFGVAVAQFTDLNGDGIIDLVVSASGDDDGGNSRGAIWILFMTDTSGPGPEADLLITKVDDIDPVIAGEPLIYFITVFNNGPSEAQNVVVTETLSTDVTFVLTGGCIEDPIGVPTCSLGNIVSGGFAQYGILVNVNEGTTGTLINLALVNSDTPDPFTDNNSIMEFTVIDSPNSPIIKFFNEIVGIIQTFSIQVLQPIYQNVDDSINIVQTFSIEVLQEITNSFNENIDIIQTFSVKILQPITSSSSQQVQILQTYSIVKNPIEVVSIEQLLDDIDSSNLSSGIKNALQNPLQSIDSNFGSLEFSATSLVTTSSKSSTGDSNSNEQNNEVCGKLDAFINKVNALSAKKIDSEDAADFIDSAEQIKENFGC